MAGQTTQSRFNYVIIVKICSTMSLYSQEEQFTTIGLELQKAQSSYDKGQDLITFNQRSNWQTERG